LEILQKTNDFQNIFPNILCSCCVLEMALLRYLMLKRHNTTNTCLECLPDASGPLAITMPSGFITATNSSVAKVLEKSSKNKLKLKSCVANTKYIHIILSEYICMV